MTSCEEVIDLKLDNSDPVIVIDAGLSNQLEYQIVRLSKTIPFDKKNQLNPFTGATISLTDPRGTQIQYTEVSPGLYQSPAFRGVPDTRYTLTVIADGQTYSASSVMPQPVKLDSINIKKFSFFGDTNAYIAVNYTDPPGIQNQYRYILNLKGKSEHEAVTEDRFNDGNAISDIILYELDDLKKGDRVDVEMQCIDRNVFKYFFAISQIGGEGGPPVAPSNPESNFSNGALGIFNAYTSQKKSLTIN